jgi:hypothetical protein
MLQMLQRLEQEGIQNPIVDTSATAAWWLRPQPMGPLHYLQIHPWHYSDWRCLKHYKKQLMSPVPLVMRQATNDALNPT